MQSVDVSKSQWLFPHDLRDLLSRALIYICVPHTVENVHCCQQATLKTMLNACGQVGGSYFILRLDQMRWAELKVDDGVDPSVDNINRLF